MHSLIITMAGLALLEDIDKGRMEHVFSLIQFPDNRGISEGTSRLLRMGRNHLYGRHVYMVDRITLNCKLQ